MDKPKKKKKKSRIRQTKTVFQETFKNHQHYIGHFAWQPLVPEFIHLSVALLENDYLRVKQDFKTVADYVNVKSTEHFHFNLSHTIKLLKADKHLLNIIEDTCFGSVIHTIIKFYQVNLDITVSKKFDFKPELLIPGFDNLLEGRSDTSILCKYLMMQYHHRKSRDYFGLFNLQTPQEIFTQGNVSRIFSAFPPSTGQSENFDLDFCDEIWMYNYCQTPFMAPKDTTEKEEQHYSEAKMDELTSEFKALYEEFKELNLLAVYSRKTAEIHMGFVGRICNLSFDVMEFVRVHKAEIAELTCRTILENFIVGCWMINRKDPALYQRFSSFSLGRDRFMAEKLSTMAEGTGMKDEAEKIKETVFEEMGASHINTASERGEIFELKIDQMAEEVWGKENKYYLFYKRYSDVTHGHWRVIEKYHLSKSLNPMQNGLRLYNENKNRFAGLVPSFVCLDMSVEIMVMLLSQIKGAEVLLSKLQDFKRKEMERWWEYFNKYIRLSEEPIAQ